MWPCVWDTPCSNPQSLRLVITIFISGEEKNIVIFAIYFMCTGVLSVCIPGVHGDLEKTLVPVKLELEMAAVTVLVLGTKPCPLWGQPKLFTSNPSPQPESMDIWKIDSSLNSSSSFVPLISLMGKCVSFQTRERTKAMWLQLIVKGHIFCNPVS